MDRPGPIDNSQGHIRLQGDTYHWVEAMPAPVLRIAYPSAQEVQHKTSQIAQITAECKLLAKQLELLNDNVAVVQSLLDARTQELSEICSYIAPLRRLPIEILSMVVSLHVRDNLQPVWVLMQTSRVWRAAALLAGDVWNAIFICPPGSGRVRMEYICGGKQRIVCHSKEQLAAAFKRTGSMPLDVTVLFDLVYASSSEHILSIKAEQVVELVKWVPTTSVRIRRLEFEREFIDTTTRISSTLSQAFQAWDLSHLEHLATWFEPLVTRAMKEAKGIKSLGGPVSILRAVNGMVRTQSIRHLDVWNLNEINNLNHLTAFKTLESLRVTNPRSVSLPTISMPHLRSLQSNIQGDLWPIMCANITHLSLFPPNQLHIYTGSVIHLPQLTHFSYKNSAFSRGSFLRYFKAPNLEVLEAIDYGTSQGTTIQAMKTIWPPAEAGVPTAVNLDPTVLKLDHLYVDSKLMSRVLLRFTRCVELHLLRMHVPVEFFEFLCPSSKNSRKSTCLPTLKILVIDLYEKKGIRKSYGAGLEHVAYLDAAKQFLQRRKAMLIPLQILSISRYGENKELLAGDGE